MPIKLNKLTRLPGGSSGEGFRYPLVTNIQGFKNWTPEAQIGAVLTESSLELMAVGIACIGSSNVLATPEAFPSVGPSTLNPKTLTRETFDREVSGGQINPFLEGASKNFITEIGPLFGAEIQNIASIEFMSTVKVSEDGQISADNFTFDFNDQLLGPDGKAVDYLVHYSFITVTEKSGDKKTYLYNTLTNDQGVGQFAFTDKDGNLHKVPNLIEINDKNIGHDQEAPNNALIFATIDGVPFSFFSIEDAFDGENFVGGNIIGFDHVNGDKLELVIDDLIGAVGVANVRANGQGDLISATGNFGDPSINPPPTPNFIDVKFTSNSQGSEIIATPLNEAASAPTAEEIAAMTPAQLAEKFPEIAGLTDITNPDSPIVQFANAFGVEPEDVGNLTPKLLTGVDGKQFIVMTTGDLASTSNFDETGIRLIVGVQGENNNWSWEEGSLKILGQLNNIRFASSGKYDYEGMISRYFGSYSGAYALSWNVSEPEEGRLDKFLLLDEASVGNKIGSDYHAYHLVWGLDSFVPVWLKSKIDSGINNEELLSILVNHVKEVTDTIAGKASMISVVNEPLGSKLNSPHLFTRLGKTDEETAQWIGKLFETAHESDPNAKLILNDTQIEFGGVKSDKIFNIVQTMKDNSVPIDGIGFQMHINASEFTGNNLQVKVEQLREQIRRYRELGISIYITEMDVDMHDVKTDRSNVQANIYKEIIRVCLEEGVVDFTFFSGMDENSWLIKEYGRTESQATLMNSKGPKIAYYALLALLSGK